MHGPGVLPSLDPLGSPCQLRHFFAEQIQDGLLKEARGSFVFPLRLAKAGRVRIAVGK